jgi:hypothetical protein
VKWGRLIITRISHTRALHPGPLENHAPELIPCNIIGYTSQHPRNYSVNSRPSRSSRLAAVNNREARKSLPPTIKVDTRADFFSSF